MTCRTTRNPAKIVEFHDLLRHVCREGHKDVIEALSDASKEGPYTAGGRLSRQKLGRLLNLTPHQVEARLRAIRELIDPQDED